MIRARRPIKRCHVNSRGARVRDDFKVRDGRSRSQRAKRGVGVEVGSACARTSAGGMGRRGRQGGVRGNQSAAEAGSALFVG